MASEQRLPYLPTADVVVLADGSRWVRERTCHVVRDLGTPPYEEDMYEMACGRVLVRPNDEYMSKFCSWCGGRIVDEKGAER